MAKKRYAQVGVGDRSFMYSFAVGEQYRDTSELVALCDNNLGRLRRAPIGRWVVTLGVPVYLDTEFDRMIVETQPDTVIVTIQRTATHDQYICRAMEAGVRRDHREADDHRTEQKRSASSTRRSATGRTCTVTFNYRYSPPRTQMKDLLMSGVIGESVSVDFHWVLDTRHGADYFRRWHRNKANSGGLLVHKATHHFDLINWWLSDVPGARRRRGRTQLLPAGDRTALWLHAAWRALSRLPGVREVPLLSRPARLSSVGRNLSE